MASGLGVTVVLYLIQRRDKYEDDVEKNAKSEGQYE